jgi:hypothetical protein
MKKNMFLFLYLVLLQVIDICITMFAISEGGTELNPVMSYYMSMFVDLQWLTVSKGVLLTIIFIGVRKNIRHIRTGLYIACCYYTIGIFFILIKF